MKEQIQAVELLQSRLRTLEMHLDVMAHEFNQEVDATIKRNKRSKGKPITELTSWNELQLFKESLRDELRGAAVLGAEHDIELNVCRKLAVTLDGGVDPLPFVLDADVELERLIERMLQRTDVPLGEDQDAVLYRKAIDRWNANAPGDSWANIAEDLTKDRAGHKAFSQAVKRYAGKYEIDLRLGDPGSKRITTNRNE